MNSHSYVKRFRNERRCIEPVRIQSTRSNLAGVDLVPFPNVTIDQYGGFGGKKCVSMYFLDAILASLPFVLNYTSFMRLILTIFLAWLRFPFFKCSK